MAGCIGDDPEAAVRSCGGDEARPGDLKLHVYPSAQHLEHADWANATKKSATITPYVDNETNRYTEDAERLPARTGPLDETDCILFEDVPPGWWEIRANARPDTPGCSWYGGGGKMIHVEEGAAASVRFQPMLACA